MADIHLDLAGPGARLASAAAKRAITAAGQAAGSSTTAAAAALASAASANLAQLSSQQIQQFATALAVPYSDLATLFAHLEQVVLGSELPVGTDFSGFYPSFAPTIAALAALPAPFDGQTVLVTSAIRGGVFVWRQGNYVAQIAADVEQGIFVKANTIPSTNGAWCRLVTDNRYQVAWFGTSAVRTDNQVPINAAFKSIPADAILVFPPYDCPCSARCISVLDKGVHVEGSAGRKSRVVVADPAATFYLFQICSSNSTVRRIGFVGGASGVAANEPTALAIGKFNYLDPITNQPVPGIVSNIVVDDVWVDGGDSGIIVGMYYAMYRNGLAPNMAAGIYAYHRDFYLIDTVTVRNCRIRCRRNGIAFYGAVGCLEHDNDVIIVPGVTSIFSSGLRVLGCIALNSHDSRFTYEQERPTSEGYGIYYALAGFNDGVGRLINVDCHIIDHKITNASIPFEIESWQGGTLELTGHVVRNDPNSVSGYPVIRCSIQGDIVNRKRVMTEGFQTLHIANIDAIGGAQFMQFFAPAKDMLIENNKWISNAYSSNDGRFPIELRDLSYVVDADGNQLSQHGMGLVRILDNELIHKSPSFAEISVIEAASSTRVIVQGNRTVKSVAAGAERDQILFQGAAGATVITDGVTEQPANASISSGLNYRYPAGVHTLVNSATGPNV